MADSEGCEKSLEGGQRRQGGASLGPFCPNTVEAGADPRDHGAKLLKAHSSYVS